MPSLFIHRLRAAVLFSVLTALPQFGAELQFDKAPAGETVTVTASRLTSTPEPVKRQPARIRVIGRAEIDASGAATLQELLQQIAGIDLIDQTGSGRELTLSLRGQSDKRGVTLLYGGIPLNAVDDHRADLFLVPLAALDAIEIYFGSAAYGDGAHGAVINLVPRASTGLPALDVTLRGGNFSDGGKSAGGSLSGGLRAGGWDLNLHLQRDSGRGFRDNGAFHETLSGLRLGKKFGVYDFALVLGTDDARHGQPGALTRAEMATAGRRQNPYNRPDFSAVQSRRLGTSLAGPMGEKFRFKADLFTHRRATDTLTTGRFAASPYGYGLYSENEQTTLGTALALAWTPLPSLDLHAGLEASNAALDLRGFTRDAAGEPIVLYGASNDENSRAAADWRSAALNLRAAWHPLAWLGGEIALRRDSTRLHYRDELQSCEPGAGVAVGGECRRSFAANGYRTGITAHPAESIDLFVAQSEGFNLPSVFDLYAFPLFGSNPDLRIERSRTREAGARLRAEKYGAAMTLFQTDFDGEVQFVLTNPAFFIGENRNVGRSRRRGVELEGHYAPGSKLRFEAALTWQRAVFRDGATTPDYSVYPPAQLNLAGKRVPLVPSRILRAGVRTEPFAHFHAGLEWRARSKSVLSNDLTNARWDAGGRVPAAQRWDLTTDYDAAHWRAGLAVRNLTGSRDENRGITDGTTDYYTPVAPREISIAVTMKLPW